MRYRTIVVGAGLLLALAGCSGQEAGTSASPTVASSATSATPSSAPTAPATPAPTTPAPTTPATSTPTTPETTAPAAAGCPANDVAVPSDAQLITIGDVDHDDRPDQEFYSESDRFVYGLRTASGATVLLPDDLAGPAAHSGWTSLRETGVVTVLDDGRSATLHAFVDCAFETTVDASGQPYTFGLAGFSDYGSGVACTDQNGGALLYGVLASRRDDGLYDITRTQILLSNEGRTARNDSATEVVAQGLAQDDPQVALAQRSTCGDTPIVSTSGR